MIEIFATIEDVLKKHPNAYLSFARIGECMVCSQEKDLRFGACFNCSDRIDGEPIKGGHRLWEKAKPSNTWYVGA